MSKKYLPFPIDLSTYPVVRELTALQYGLLRLIIERYWETGREIPKNESILYHGLRCDFKTWSRARSKVYEALQIVVPDVVKARDERLSLRLKRQKMCHEMQSINRIVKRSVVKHLSDETMVHEAITAVSPPEFSNQYNQGRFDAKERIKAIKSKQNDDGKKFTD